MASASSMLGESATTDLASDVSAQRSSNERALGSESESSDVVHLPDGSACSERRRIPLLPSVRAAMLQLLQAYDYAEDLRKSVWDFAIELACLRQFGVTRNDCRWLVHKGYVERGQEIAIDVDGRRTFESITDSRINDEISFVLTHRGCEFAKRLQAEGALLPASLTGMMPNDSNMSQAMSTSCLDSTKPVWDQQRQELRIGRVIIKQYKVPAANQEAILASFEEEDWPPRIDDPLIPKGDQDPKRRLHDTINSLNRNQKRSILHFFGDGTGQGVRWEYRPENTSLLGT